MIMIIMLSVAIIINTSGLIICLMWAVNSNHSNRKILASLEIIHRDMAHASRLKQVYDTVAMTRVEMFKQTHPNNEEDQ